MNGNELVDLFFVLLMAGILLRTLYVRRAPAKHKAILAKYQRNTPQYRFWVGRYSDRFLLGLCILAATSVLQLASDYYKYDFRHPSELILALENLVSLAAILYALYLLRDAAGIKKPKTTRPKGWSNLS